MNSIGIVNCIGELPDQTCEESLLSFRENEKAPANFENLSKIPLSKGDVHSELASMLKSVGRVPITDGLLLDVILT